MFIIIIERQRETKPLRNNYHNGNRRFSFFEDRSQILYLPSEFANFGFSVIL